jgi:hypothetical protein
MLWREAQAPRWSQPRALLSRLFSQMTTGHYKTFPRNPADIFTREMVRFLHPRLSGVIAALRRSTLLL